MPNPLDYLKQAQTRIAGGVTPDPTIQAQIQNPEGHLLGAMPVPEGLLEGVMSKIGGLGSRILSRVSPGASSALQGLSEAAPTGGEVGAGASTSSPFGNPGPYKADIPLRQQVAEYNQGRMAKIRGGLGDVPANPQAQALEAARKGLQDAAPSSSSPIQQFYARDPQARIGGEGRMTGSFQEGSGGLSDVAAGKVSRYPMPQEDMMSWAQRGLKAVPKAEDLVRDVRQGGSWLTGK